MMAVMLRGLTLKEFLRLPEQEPALEYFNGTVTQKVAPMGEHSALQLGCALLLEHLFRPGRIARAFPELRMTHSGASLVPDVSLYRWERIPRTPTGKIANRFLIPPDVAIEIRSPGQAIREMVDKCQWFVDNGSLLALLIDPRRETIREFRPGVPPIVRRRGDSISLDEISPGAALDVSGIFAALDLD
jgi:Uma2 family endonuclease